MNVWLNDVQKHARRLSRVVRALTPIHDKTMKEAETQIHSFPDHRKPHARLKIRIPERQIWNGMLGRCYNSRMKVYRFYGALGVRVCEQWHNPEKFYSDMGDRPSKNHSLDRWPDKSGHYSPDNCRWATKIEQANNCKDNIVLNYNGESKTLPQWCRQLGLNLLNTRQRIKVYKWSIEDAFTKPNNLTQFSK